MKGLGAVLVLLGGFWTRYLALEERRRIIRWGEELYRLLELLERGIFTLRQPLPRLLSRCRERAELSAPFWTRVLEGLGGGFAGSWQQAVSLVPALYRPLLEPLGASLTAGEDAELINLTKEEVRRAAAEERRQLGERGRLATALCLSAALLTIVVLL